MNSDIEIVCRGIEKWLDLNLWNHEKRRTESSIEYKVDIDNYSIGISVFRTDMDIHVKICNWLTLTYSNDNTTIHDTYDSIPISESKIKQLEMCVKEQRELYIEEKLRQNHQAYVDVIATTIKTWITETFECPIIELGKYAWLISKDGNNVAIGITLKSGSIIENIWLMNPENPIIFYDSYYQPLLFVPAKYNDPVTWEALEDLRDRLNLAGKAYNNAKHEDSSEYELKSSPIAGINAFQLEIEEKNKRFKAIREEKQNEYKAKIEEKQNEYKAMRQFIDELKKLVADNPELAAKNLVINCADDILYKQP